ncbi:MAG: TonB-dependent receptor [Dysgonamonadaceae bacterium]|jgi:TonB-linked SusC/RagA family outer membrane protein|nr:TonB-dependent receptor [Dysgonamonadaceae bacterium]
MDKNHKKKQGLSGRLLAAILGMCFFAGGGVSATAGSSNDGSAIATSGQQQALVANGIVVDAMNEPVIGATVMEKGTTNGIATDLDGKFSLHVQPNATLLVSYLGFQPQEVKAGKDLRIVLLEDNRALEEVVVIGYGVQKKKLVTGATVQVKGEDIARLNTPTILGALQSQAPGVEITQTSGFIGDGFKVNIRGLGTNGSNTPLYIVDGVVGGIDGLSPNDIESIDVLKDAASAAIYGARAANGVILVTTKKGKEGKFEISYDGYYGVSNLYKIPTILNAQEYMAIVDEAQLINGLDAYNWINYLPESDLAAIQNGTWKGTNWLKEILNKNAVTQNHSVSIMSGTERMRTSMGINYLSQEATMGVPKAIPKLQKANFRLNTEQVIYKLKDFDLFKVGETLNYSYSHMKGQVPRNDIYWNSVHNMLVMSPLMHPYNAKGNYYVLSDQQADGYSWDVSNGANKNPIAYMDYTGNQNISKSYGLLSSVYAELQPIKNLKIRSQFGYNFSASSYRSYTPAHEPLSSNVLGGSDNILQQASSGYSWSLDNTVNYVFDLDGGHNFDVLLGQGLSRSGYGETLRAENHGSSFSDFEHAFLSNAKGTSTITAPPKGDSWGESALISFFGRVSYNYQEKYLLSLIMRADGSSVFARGNRWGYFPSVSAGWVISNEGFWNVTNAINFLKIRLSYGQNGNNNVSANQHLALILPGQSLGYAFGNSMGDPALAAYPMRLTNPNLKWETQEMINFGVDARFLRNRLGVELDAYQRTTLDWLVKPQIPLYWGADPAYINGGNTRNTGLETIIRWNDNINKDFYYGANLSLGFNKNEVVKVASADRMLHGRPGVLWGTAPETFRVEEGKPMGFFYGYKTAGVWQNQQQIDEYRGAKSGKPEPGDLIWVDANGDGVIDANDKTMIGNPHPDLTLGFSFNVGYKGFDLNVTTYGAFGHQIMKCYRDFVTSPNHNYTTDVFERWHGEGTSNRMPRLASSSSQNYSWVSDIYVEDGDYLKIKNVSLGYDFKRLLPKLPIQQLKLYVTAQNLFTFTGYSGMDPEIGYSPNDENDVNYSWTKGVDLGFYPSARTYMVGVNIKF